MNYSEVGVIPRGAAKLKVHQQPRKIPFRLSACLVLQREDGSFALNGGGWISGFPSLVEAGGLALHYSGWSSRREVLRALTRAPLSEELRLAVYNLGSRRAVRITYSYYLHRRMMQGEEVRGVARAPAGKPRPEPNPVLRPHPSPVSRLHTTPVSKPDTSPVPKPDPTSVPRPDVTSVPKQDTIPVPRPDITSVPKPDPTSVLKWDTIPVPRPDITSVPKPDPTSVLKWDTIPVPRPDITSVPKPDPTSVLKWDTIPVPRPDITSVPKPDPTSVLKWDTIPVPRPDITSVPKPDPTSVLKWDTIPVPRPDITSDPKTERIYASSQQSTLSPQEQPTPIPTGDLSCFPSQEPTPVPTQDVRAVLTLVPVPLPTMGPTSGSWQTGFWQFCSVSCGVGWVSRRVVCTDKAGRQAKGCNQEQKPHSMALCVRGSCSTGKG
ncbi:uncharacterized protein [Hemitrygon akajei]|uniref:uncharacterized protein n=1 Tax=Hemitrygon akajei TaxID=2704970 RepID=UPI003BF9D828